MPAIFEQSRSVTDDEIDPQGHVNNIVYLRWMQDAAIAHSTQQGWSTADYRVRGWAWVVRSHFIEYRRPAMAGDSVLIKTWVATMERFTSLRKYEIRHAGSGKLLARAETNWAFVDTATGRILAIPIAVGDAFLVVSD